MAGPLHRGASGGRIANLESIDSQMKDRSENVVADNDPFAPDASLSLCCILNLAFPSNSLKYDTSRNTDFRLDPFSSKTSKSRHSLILHFIRLSLVFIVFLALFGSLRWMLSLSTPSRYHIFKGYRWLQEQLILDLSDIEELTLSSTKLKEAEFCSEEYENYIPCYNISKNIALGYNDGKEYDRQCDRGFKQRCVLLPPKNYKIPLRWPTGQDVIWFPNVQISAQEVLSSGSLTRRMMMLEDDQISFRSDSLMFAGVEDYSHQIAEMIGVMNFNLAGVRTILDIGCGYGSFGAHLFSKHILTMCTANYEASGSQVQLTLERGLPGIIGSFISKQLPYPSLSFDMMHCARCGIDWDQKDGIFLVEADRVLKPGGYFVMTSSLTSIQGSSSNKENQKKWNFIRDFSENLCWVMLSQQDETVVWKKTSTKSCYASRKCRKPGSSLPICGKAKDVESPYYHPLQLCIGGTRSRRWIPIEERTTWPSRANMNSTELKVYGVDPEYFSEDALNWRSVVSEYWSLLSPLLFSDHPKRPGDEEPSPPFNMLRNVLDMNAKFGGFNHALLEAGKNVWVMNVVPTTGPNHLPLILDRGFVGALHDWCEAFPTYPRTYDMVHADGLLSLETEHKHRSTSLDILVEIDRLLRPEGWVVIRDTVSLIDSAREIASQLRWEARVVETETNSNERILICQKPLLKQQM